MRVFTLLMLTSLNIMVALSAPAINAPWGRILGTDIASPEGTVYSAYLGIPFALPPVGERRFAKPVPHPGPGEGRTFNASALGYVCPQPPLEVLPSFPAINEDCLTLNVYVPATPAPPEGRSVMVWIFGGGFFVGSTAGYKPSKLVLDGDVIVVTIQYRVGIFGFLSTGSDVLPGNWGLWDQQLAMAWVKDNVAAFGGRADTITLFGESAGAGSISFHHLNPRSAKLFARGIQQSGNPTAFWAINKDPADMFRKLARRTNCACPNGDCSSSGSGSWWSAVWRGREGERAEQERWLACFRDLSMGKVLEHTVWLTDEGKLDIFQATPWIPVVDGAFIPKPPEEMLADPEYLLSTGVLAKDVMIGVNNDEGGYVLDFVVPEDAGGSTDDGDDDASNDVFTAFASFKAVDEDMESQVLKNELKYRYPELTRDQRRLDTLTEILSFFYIQPVKDGKVDVQAVADTFADTYFTTGAVEMSRALARAALQYPQQSTGSLYLYLFDHFPARKADQPLRGMNHAEDLFYQFDASPLFPQDQFNADDFTVQQNFIDMLTDFAKNGKSFDALNSQLGGNWPQYTLDDQSYLSLNAQPKVDKRMYGRRISLWLDLLPSLVNSTRPARGDCMGVPSMLYDYYNYGGWNNPPCRNVWYFKFQGKITP